MFLRKNKPSLQRQFSYGAKPDSIPSDLRLAPWKTKVLSAYTGPNTGLTRLEVDADTPLLPPDSSEVAGVTNWNNPTDYAYGLSLSLYEEDKSRSSIRQRLIGDPIADVFGVVVRENNSIIAIADGSGWGRKPRLAARCAVNAAISHINENIDKLTIKKPTSNTLSKLLYDSIGIAQRTILQHGGTLTTLSVAVSCQMESHKSSEWGLFIASVGDSPICVYCPHSQSILDVTVGCHNKDGSRHVQQSGGALGPAIGTLPDLDNLTLAYTPVSPGDIVIAMTDGIMDNFAPNVIEALNEERKTLFRTDDADSGFSNSPHLDIMMEDEEQDISPHLSTNNSSNVSPNDSPLISRDGKSPNDSPLISTRASISPNDSPLISRNGSISPSDSSSRKSTSPSDSPLISRSPRFGRFRLPLGQQSPLLQRTTQYDTKCIDSPHVNEASWIWDDHFTSSTSSNGSSLIQHRSLRYDTSLVYHDKEEDLSGSSFHVMDLMQCCEPIQELGRFLKRHQNELLFDHLSAQTVASATINAVVEATESKRRFRSDCLEKGIDINRKKKTDPEFAREVEQYCGKLDHATIVAYCIGIH